MQWFNLNLPSKQSTYLLCDDSISCTTNREDRYHYSLAHVAINWSHDTLCNRLWRHRQHVDLSLPGQNDRHSAADIFKCILWMKSFVLRFAFYWSCFLNVQLRISQHCNGLGTNRRQAINWISAGPVLWCIYAAQEEEDIICDASKARGRSLWSFLWAWYIF